MKVFEYNLDREFYFPDYIYTDERICFLDIETDGLSHIHNNIILVGLLLHSRLKSSIIQVFCEKPSDEYTLILTLAKLLKSIDTLVTYNGAAFDIPFIKKKLEKYKVDDFFSSVSHIDIYKKVKRYKGELELEDCKLKTVERRLGIYREDTISGKESVLLYKEYLSNPSHSIRKTILKHNYDDVYYLPHILEIEKHLESRDTVSLRCAHRIIRVSIEKDGLKLKKNSLKIRCMSPIINSSDVLSYEDIYTLCWNKSTGQIALDLALESGFLDTGEVTSYLYVSSLNLSSNYMDNDVCIVSIDSNLQRDNILYLITEILKNWT